MKKPVRAPIQHIPIQHPVKISRGGYWYGTLLRSDRGGEYMGNDFQLYLSNHNIQHQTSVARTPEQNGVAERSPEVSFTTVIEEHGDENLTSALVSSVNPLEEPTSCKAALIKNETWSLGIRPVGRTVVKSGWVLKKKLDPSGLPPTFKARLVAKGYSQVPGRDYFETFSPAAKHDSIRTILGIIAA